MLYAVWVACLFGASIIGGVHSQSNNGSVHFGPHLNDNRLHNAYGQFCGIDSEDRLLCWGRSLKPDSTMAEAVEPRVLSEGRWSQVGVGKNHLCALNKDDRLVYCMGSGSNGQLGDGSPVGKETKIKELTPIVGGKEFQYLTVGDNHACAIGVTQNAFCWGSNEYGQLGNGDRISSSTPLKVFSDVDSWTTISAGAEHTCGTKNAIEAWCWGNNLHREVNSSPEDSIVTPSRIDGSWRMVQAGDGYTLAIDGVGKGFGWGVNERVNVDFAYGGMLGDNSTTMCYDPATKTLCPEADEVAAKANSSDSDSTTLTEPEILKTENIVPIAGDHLWSSITSGGRIPCGIELITGKLLCWGYTLGMAYVDGSPQTLFPTSISGNQSDAAWAVASSGVAGSRCGIQKNGLGFCWGLNEVDCGDNCPLGDGKTQNSPIPVQVKGVKSWLAAGSDVNATETALTIGGVAADDIVGGGIAQEQRASSRCHMRSSVWLTLPLLLLLAVFR